MQRAGEHDRAVLPAREQEVADGVRRQRADAVEKPAPRERVALPPEGTGGGRDAVAQAGLLVEPFGLQHEAAVPARGVQFAGDEPVHRVLERRYCHLTTWVLYPMVLISLRV